ncbi:protein-L-isoaspartate(D-aspartate) O-methyltransferase [Nakamurella sp. UYEF19]|uniref:methyltransferase, FxLD system n=1 Tax=Nakamurella sp. UYEF19 TaxID=1756392 RepID=UPI003393E98D
MGDYDGFSVLRGQLVDRLSAARYVTTDVVAEAFRAVPRHVFLPGVELGKAYADEAVVTKWESDGQPISSSSQPAVMAMMLEQLAVESGQRVLEIGAGTGFNAALLAHLAGEAGAVTTIDIDQDLVAQARRNLDTAGHARVDVVCSDGAEGWAANAPYDRIILTAGAGDLTPAWVEQLAPGGRLVLPLSLRGAQRSVAFERSGDHLASVSIVDCGFMPLRGTLARPGAVHQLGEVPGLLLKPGDGREVDAAALSAALRQPGEAFTTGVSVIPAEVMGGLGLWLALHEPDVGHLSALGEALGRGLAPAAVLFPGMALTTVLLGEQGLAALVRADEAGVPADRFDLQVQPFGQGATDLAHRLATQVLAWQAAGRPLTTALRIRAYPRNVAGDEANPMVIDTAHARLLLDW